MEERGEERKAQEGCSTIATCALLVLLFVQIPPWLREPEGSESFASALSALGARGQERPGRPRPLAAPPPEPPRPPEGGSADRRPPAPARGAEENPGGRTLAPVAPLPPANP